MKQEWLIAERNLKTNKITNAGYITETLISTKVNIYIHTHMVYMYTRIKNPPLDDGKGTSGIRYGGGPGAAARTGGGDVAPAGP